MVLTLIMDEEEEGFRKTHYYAEVEHSLLRFMPITSGMSFGTLRYDDDPNVIIGSPIIELTPSRRAFRYGKSDANLRIGRVTEILVPLPNNQPEYTEFFEIMTDIYHRAKSYIKDPLRGGGLEHKSFWKEIGTTRYLRLTLAFAVLIAYSGDEPVMLLSLSDVDKFLLQHSETIRFDFSVELFKVSDPLANNGAPYVCVKLFAEKIWATATATATSIATATPIATATANVTRTSDDLILKQLFDEREMRREEISDLEQRMRSHWDKYSETLLGLRRRFKHLRKFVGLNKSDIADSD